jgi:hypothetical protein
VPPPPNVQPIRRQDPLCEFQRCMAKVREPRNPAELEQLLADRLGGLRVVSTRRADGDHVGWRDLPGGERLGRGRGHARPARGERRILQQQHHLARRRVSATALTGRRRRRRLDYAPDRCGSCHPRCHPGDDAGNDGIGIASKQGTQAPLRLLRRFLDGPPDVIFFLVSHVFTLTPAAPQNGAPTRTKLPSHRSRLPCPDGRPGGVTASLPRRYRQVRSPRVRWLLPCRNLVQVAIWPAAPTDVGGIAGNASDSD